MDTDERKNAAADFLQMVIEGQIKEAYDKYVDMRGEQHNIATPTGFAALQNGMTDVGAKFPEMKFAIKHVVGDDDFVAVHSHLILKEDDPGYITVHLFRFDHDRIVEMWDVSQQIPEDSPNEDGAF